MSLTDLESLRCFQAAAEHLNFRLAARAVALSPTAFSERIRRLEEELGARLFERTTRKVWLTPAGQRLVDASKAVFAAARACETAVLSDDVTPYAFTLGTRFELGMSYILPQLTLLQKKRPERTIHLQFGDSPDLLHRLRQGTLDACISSVRFTDNKLQYVALHEEKYVFCAKPGVVSREHPLTEVEHAQKHCLLDIDGTLPLFSYFLDAKPRNEVWRFHRVDHLGTIAAIRHRLLEGAGVAVIPEYFVRKDLAAKRLVTVGPPVTLEADWFRLIWKSGHPQHAELEGLARELSDFPLQ